MDIQTKVERRIQERSVGALIKAFLKSIVSKSAWERISEVRWYLWDMWHNVETRGLVDIESLSIVGDNRTHAVQYEPSGSVHSILRDLYIDFRKYGFIDFGSGKGRVLLQASGFPFESVQGVEFSVELHMIAESNIQRYRRSKIRCGAVRSILADATEFDLPTIPLVLYFFNPFVGPVLASVIDNVRQSIVAHPREIIIICAGKWMSTAALDRVPNIQVIWRRPYSTVYLLPTSFQAQGKLDRPC